MKQNIVLVLSIGILCGSALSALPAKADTKLTWPPPVGWERFETVTIPAEGGTISLPDNRKDYRLIAPEIVRQGLQLVAESRPADSVPGPIMLRRVNLEAVELPDEVEPHRHAGHVGLSWYGDSTGQMFIDNGTVWFQHHVNSGWGARGGFRKGAYRDASGVVRLDPVSAASEFEHNFRAGRKYPMTESRPPWLAQRGEDTTGVFVTWPADATAFNGKSGFRNWDDTGEGRIYSRKPPAGDYVPLDSVGVGYQSPGYRSALRKIGN